MVSAAATLICAAAVCACGGSSHSSTNAKYLNIAHVERAIKQSIMSQRHLASTVVCPARVLQKPGKFPCIATTHSRKQPHRKIKTPFVVTIHNDRGYVTYIGR